MESTASRRILGLFFANSAKEDGVSGAPIQSEAAVGRRGSSREGAAVHHRRAVNLRLITPDSTLNSSTDASSRIGALASCPY